MRKMSDARESRGLSIAKLDGQVRRIDEHTYTIKSQSGNGEYHVTASEIGWNCSCPDFVYRGQKCKHIHAIEFSRVLRKHIATNEVIIHELSIHQCPVCQSGNIVKHGIRHNKYGDIQRFTCKDCRKRFTINLGFERMKATPQVITSALQLYFTGESLRNVQKFLKLQGVV